jgi:hypothetical protein
VGLEILHIQARTRRLEKYIEPSPISSVVENGRAKRRTVKIGQRNAQGAEVLEGLAPGETVSAANQIELLSLTTRLWHRLVRSHGLPRPAARRVLVQFLLAVIEPAPTSPTTTGSRRK